MKIIGAGRFLFWAAVLVMTIANLVGDTITKGV